MVHCNLASKHAMLLLCFAAVYTMTAAEVLHSVKQCDASGTLKEVRITPCPSEPCELKHNSKPEIEIDFILNAPSSALGIAMYGILLEPLEVKWNGVSEDACANITDASGKSLCPITDGSQMVTYKNRFEVKNSYPTVQVTIKVTIYDAETKDIIVCFKFASKITD